MDPKVLKGLRDLGYGENAEIPAEELIVTAEFQRKLRPRNWDEFIPALFGRAIVAEVKGKHYLVDGIHRFDEGQRHGMWETQPVPCVLYAGCTMAQAAGLYHMANVSRIALKAADSFRAACYSGDENMRALDQDLLDVGLDGWCMGRAERDCTAIGAVLQVAEKYGREHALYTLDTISECWGWVDKDDEAYAESSPHHRTVKGFGEYLRPEKKIGNRRYPRRWDRENGPILSGYIATHYPGQVGLLSFLARASQRRAAGGGGGLAAAVEEHVHHCFLAARRELRKEAA
jgi:hypothetical protein